MGETALAARSLAAGSLKNSGMEEYLPAPRRVHPTASVHRMAVVENASIGARTKVWQFASVIRNARIGEDCNIASCAIVDGSRLGDRCIISHGAFIDPGVLIEDDVFIGPHVIFCNDAWPRVHKRDFDMAPMISGECVISRIESGASLGARVTVLPGIVIGARAMIAAGAIVDRDVPGLHLFKRNGTMAEIDASHAIRRVRVARGVLPLAAE